ncbi:MAG: hypothetical protein Q8L29_04460 [archaeon]|nr:hypothetical protein [archaeon]
MNKNIPQVEFRVAKFTEIFPVIDYFLNPSETLWDWSGRIYKVYPEIKERLSKVKDRKKRKEIASVFFQEILERDKKQLEEKSRSFQKDWDKMNNEIMRALSEAAEIDWPDTDKKFIARVSLNPICPRDVKRRNFDIFYKQDTKKMIGTSIHEIYHFIYFEKWKEVFPKAKENEFNDPHLVWRLSEMVPRIVLNDKRIQKVFRYEFDSYKVYESAKLNGRHLLSYLQYIYDNKKDFPDFLRKSWKFVKENQKEIEKI